MKLWAKQKGFTIVELLVVIVVISILVSITVVSYNGVQKKSRDGVRSQTIAQIQRALESYKSEKGRYPAHIGVSTNVPSGFMGDWGTGYSYSVDTAGNWMKELVDAKKLPATPLDPTNNNTYYFTYWSSMSHGACKEPFYILAAIYEEPTSVPSNSRSLNCNGEGIGAHWPVTATRAVFSNIRTPGT